MSGSLSPRPCFQAQENYEVHLWRLSLPMKGVCAIGDLSPEEQREAASYSDENDVIERELSYDMTRTDYHSYCVARRSILSLYSEHAPCIMRTPFGKPYLHSVSGEEPVVFSVSHAAGLIYIAVTRRQTIGIDLELIDMTVDYSGEARLFFSSSEQEWLFSHTPQDRPYAFLRVWTLKEAYRKWIGLGEQYLGWREFSIEPAPVHSCQPARLYETPFQERMPRSLVELRVDSGYIGALAFGTNDAPLEDVVVTLQGSGYEFIGTEVKA